MSGQQRILNRIYLDNAATSWPKPPAVAEAVAAYLRDSGAPAGRSGYSEAIDAQRAVNDCRRRVAQLISAAHPKQVAMAFNGTDALNIALHGLLRQGGHVVTTVTEHNSVLRPLAFLQRHCGVAVTRIECDATGRVDARQVVDAIGEQTKLVAVSHVSNVTGAIQPVEEIGRQMAGGGDALLLVDAAQSLGHLPLSVAELRADLLAASGHKGLLGPLGTGVLYVGPRAAERLEPLRQGGTGTNSESEEQPTALPERLESGNLNVAGLVGLAAALEQLDQAAVAARRKHEQQLVARLLEQLEPLAGITVHGPPAGAGRTGVVSVTAAAMEPQELAMLLDASQRVQTRAGLHCAPLMHRALGTDRGGGTLRISIGPYNTAEQIDVAAAALGELSG